MNVDAGVKTRNYGNILRSNICTLFNLVNVILAAFVFFTGSYKNMLFMLVIRLSILFILLRWGLLVVVVSLYDSATPTRFRSVGYTHARSQDRTVGYVHA